MLSKKVEAIEQAFCRLLQKNSFEKITVSRICQDAGVSRATFYTYFEDTRSLLSEIEDRTLDGLLQIQHKWASVCLSTLCAEPVSPKFLDIARYIYTNQDIFGALFGPYGNESYIFTANQCAYLDFLRLAQAEGTKSPELLASCCAGAVIALCRSWAADTSLATPEEIAQLHTAIVYRMLMLQDHFPVPASQVPSWRPSLDDLTPPEETLWKWVRRGKPFAL